MKKFLYAEFTARAGFEAKVSGLVHELALRVRAEPGNIVFDIHTKFGSERSFFVYEVYRDEASFATHLAADYGFEFNRELAGLIEEDGSQLTLLDHI